MSLACVGALVAACGFFERVQIGIDVARKVFIESVRSYSINLHQFLSFELLQLLVEITSLVYINKMNRPCLTLNLEIVIAAKSS